MLNAIVGVLRSLTRGRAEGTTGTRSGAQRGATRIADRTIATTAALLGRAGLASLARGPLGRRRPGRARRAVTLHLASGQILPIGVAVVVLLASVISLGPGSSSAEGANGPSDPAARIAIGGGTYADQVEADIIAGAARAVPAATDALDDGTMWKPVAVDTSLQDGKGLLQYYTVQSGDTLTGIASRFGLSMMTLWWANSLTTKDSLHIGQVLMIPPVDGLVVTVAAGDTLDSIAAKYKVDGSAILQANGLTDDTLIVGQTLVVPGAEGAPIPTTAPVKRVASSGGGFVYTGGSWAWPVVGGGNYISQYFHYGHYAVDIAAQYGTPIVSALPGTVVFAGWLDDGGGYQVWVSHGSNLYTCYLHMSSITTSVGAYVARGQQIGRIGMTGWATGPHVHFEVWVGYPWKGYRVNPLKYY